jgi:hypothetical protein
MKCAADHGVLYAAAEHAQPRQRNRSNRSSDGLTACRGCQRPSVKHLRSSSSSSSSGNIRREAAAAESPDVRVQ